jgi:hypothetical protein
MRSVEGSWGCIEAAARKPGPEVTMSKTARLPGSTATDIAPNPHASIAEASSATKFGVSQSMQLFTTPTRSFWTPAS